MAPQAQAKQLIAGRYRLLSKLGAGGFGEVWKAYDETLRLDVAVKAVRLPPAASAEEQAERLARAAREARNAARLRDHPNVVAVHDVVVDGGVPWTVMQLVVGSSLQERLDAHGPLPEDRAAALASAMLNALGAAHDAGIVHRDVKPANVMLAGDRFLLTDFGIAVHAQDTALTGAGMIIGSAEYMAPERARGRDGLAASDLFSLGVMLYQAVQGVSPFRRGTFDASLAAVLFEDPPPLRRAGGLGDLITRLLAKSPDQRPSTAEAQALLHAAAPSAGRGGPDGAGTSEVAPSRHERAQAALAKAERLALRLSEDAEKAWGLCRLAQVAAAFDADLARRFADGAEDLVRGIPPREDSFEAVLLAEIAKSLAVIDPDRARRLAAEAERVARGLPGRADQVLGLAEIANRLTEVDPDRIRTLVEEVQRFAPTVFDRFHAAETLDNAADALAALDPVRARRIRAQAVQGELFVRVDPPGAADEHAARTAFGRGKRVRALCAVAWPWAGTDPGRAQLLLDEAERTAAKLLTGSARAEASGDIGEAQARIAQQLAGVQPGLALAWADQGRDLVYSLPDGPAKQRVQGAWAGTLPVVAAALALDDPDQALRLATEAQNLAGSVSTERELRSLVTALGGVARILALTDPGRALDLLERTRFLAAGRSEPGTRNSALGQVVHAMAAVALRSVDEDPDRAERSLRAAERCLGELPHGEEDDPYPAHAVVEAMTQAVDRLAGEHPERARALVKRAQRLARDLPPGVWRDRSQALVVAALAAVDPEQAEGSVREIPDRDDRVTVWIAVARAWAATA